MSPHLFTYHVNFTSCVSSSRRHSLWRPGYCLLLLFTVQELTAANVVNSTHGAASSFNFFLLFPANFQLHLFFNFFHNKFFLQAGTATVGEGPVSLRTLIGYSRPTLWAGNWACRPAHRPKSALAQGEDALCPDQQSSTFIFFNFVFIIIIEDIVEHL